MDVALLDTLIGVGGVLGGVTLGWSLSWWQGQARERQEREGTRQLVAAEIIDNFTYLDILVGTLRMTSEQRSALVTTFDRAFSFRPKWRRMQWDKASAAAFSPDELYRINDWYSQLKAVSILSKRVAAHSTLIREQQQTQPGHSLDQWKAVVDELENLGRFVQSVYEQGRPFVHKHIDEAHEKDRLRREVLAQKETGQESSGIEEAPPGS